MRGPGHEVVRMAVTYHDVLNVVIVAECRKPHSMQQADEMYEVVFELVIRLRLQRRRLRDRVRIKAQRLHCNICQFASKRLQLTSTLPIPAVSNESPAAVVLTSDSRGLWRSLRSGAHQVLHGTHCAYYTVTYNVYEFSSFVRMIIDHFMCM